MVHESPLFLCAGACAVRRAYRNAAKGPREAVAASEEISASKGLCARSRYVRVWYGHVRLVMVVWHRSSPIHFTISITISRTRRCDGMIPNCVECAQFKEMKSNKGARREARAGSSMKGLRWMDPCQEARARSSVKSLHQRQSPKVLPRDRPAPLRPRPWEFSWLAVPPHARG